MSESDFAIEETSTGGSDLTWLRSSFGMTDRIPGTLDLSDFTAQINAYGVLPSGIAVGKVTATGRYGIFDGSATDGTEVLAGFICPDVRVTNSRGVQNPSGKAAFSLLTMGQIKRSRLPVVAQRTSITRTTATSGQFVFVD